LPKIIYETNVIKIGKYVPDMLSEKILILFKENVPDELADYCILHSGNKLYEEIVAGDEVQIRGESFKITAVGELVNKHLAELGHTTIKFDGSTVAELPGSLHVEGKDIPSVFEGDIIIVVRK
jgi:PTS system glucitol/sorbitol-specific IIA component